MTGAPCDQAGVSRRQAVASETQSVDRQPPAHGTRRHYDLGGAGADYPERDGAPGSTLLLCTQQRSGSTLLAEALYFAGGTGCALEYFHGGFRPSFAGRWQTADLSAYVERLYRHRTDPSGMLGVKLFWSDIVTLVQELAGGGTDRSAGVPAGESASNNMDRRAAELAGARVDRQVYRDVHALLAPLFPRPRYLRLTRDDKIAQAISTSFARQRRRWRQIDSADPAHRRPVEFRFHGIASALSRIQRHDAHWQGYFEANQIEPIDVRYEALAENYDGEVRRVLDLLGRHDAAVPPARMHKQGDAQSEQFGAQFRAQFRRLTRGQQA